MMTRVHNAQTLIEAIDSGSIAGAARALNMTRSAASKSIQALEEALGVRLLNRSTRRISLTEPGEIYVRALRSALGKIDAVEAEISRYAHGPVGTLVIDASVIFGKRFLAPIVQGFLEAYPKVSIDLHIGDELSDTVAGNVDLFFRTGRVRHQDMVAVKLQDIVFRTVAAAAYLATARTPSSIDDLANHNCLNYRFPTDNNVFRWRFRQGDTTVFRQVSGNFQTTDAEELRRAAVEGAGIAHLPGQLVDDDIAAGRLVELFPETAFVSNAISLCYPEAKRNDPKITLFKRYLLSRMARGGPATAPATPPPWQ